jgi:hypothetical protein
MNGNERCFEEGVRQGKGRKALLLKWNVQGNKGHSSSCYMREMDGSQVMKYEKLRCQCWGQ